jgi:hypothetical protein
MITVKVIKYSPSTGLVDPGVASRSWTPIVAQDAANRPRACLPIVRW